MGLLRALAGATQSQLADQWKLSDNGEFICGDGMVNCLFTSDGTAFFVPHDIVNEVSHFIWERADDRKIKSSFKDRDIYISLNNDMMAHPTFSEILELCYCLSSNDYNSCDSIKYKDKYLDTVLKCSYASV